MEEKTEAQIERETLETLRWVIEHADELEAYERYQRGTR